MTKPQVKDTIDIPISVCLIAKNERRNVPILAEHLREILGHPDDEVILVDTGSVDSTTALAQKHGWKVFLHPELCDLNLNELRDKYLSDFEPGEAVKHPHFKGGVLRSFAEARNLSFSYAKNEVCLWLDLDDSLRNPHYLRPTIDRLFANGTRGALMMLYEYAADEEDGSCITQLWRERVVTKSDFEWRGRCHEVLCPREGIQPGLKMMRNPNFPTRVVHRYHKPTCFSDVRNYLIMRYDLETKHDPRTLFYLGNAARGMGRDKEAVEWYIKFADQSGSRDDVFCARLSAATCYNKLGRHWKAQEQVFEAMRTNPQDPRVYYFMADCWFHLKHYANCLAMIRLGDQLQIQDTLHAVDPTTLGFQPAALGVMAARELRLTDLALEFAERAYKERPNLPVAKKGLEDTQRWAEAQKQSEMAAALIGRSKDPIEAAKLLPMSPHMLMQGIGEPEEALEGDGTSITFFCGHTSNHWGPPEVMKGKGIGASEKMVYEAARALASRGYRVFVYCTLPREGDEGVYEGVHYKFTARFNYKLHRDHLVLWRMPQLVDKMPFNADRIYVWMHDMGHNGVWTEDILALTDKVFFLSKWQRGLHPAVPEEKVFYTRNGIDLEKHLYKGEEKKKRIVFASSPDRGFQRAIRLFDKSGLHEEGWELHLFYGFGETFRRGAIDQEFGHVVELSKDMRLLAYEDECYELAQSTPGVVYRGGVDWKTMAQEFKEADIWLYPTNFGEISCVAAMEAMAAGCKVVATDSAALAETLKGYPGWYFLDQKDLAKWPQVLRSAAAEQGHPEQWCEHARKFDMNGLATDWSLMFAEDE